MPNRRRFLLSDLVADRATAAYEEHARRIIERLPRAEVRHVGGTSVAGVLTTGDVDLQVRVTTAEFPAARDALAELYEPLYPESWHESAYFQAPASDPPVELALTVIGTADDRCHGESWQRIASDSVLIEKYNALKRAHEEGALAEYQAAKRTFFAENFGH